MGREKEGRNFDDGENYITVDLLFPGKKTSGNIDFQKLNLISFKVALYVCAEILRGFRACMKFGWKKEKEKKQQHQKSRKAVTTFFFKTGENNVKRFFSFSLENNLSRISALVHSLKLKRGPTHV